MFGYNASIAPYDFNLAKAAAYLKLAIDNRTGNSYADEGFQLKLYFNLGNDDRELACKNFKDNLERLTSLHLINGTISVTYQGQDWASTYLPNQRNGKLAIFFLGWAPDYNDPDDYALPFLHSVMGTYPTTIGLVNLTLDQMIIDAAHQLNLTQRAQAYSEITQACQDNAYYVWLSQATNFHTERTWVHGYYFNPMFSGLYFFPQYKSAVA
jgi:peptide/nickel transport system substrate-binding protein